jgi:hypothetical protein
VETITRIWCDFSSRAARIKEIVRDLKVSRNTVRKVLGSGKTLSALRCPGDPEGEKRPMSELAATANGLTSLKNHGRCINSLLTMREIGLLSLAQGM